MGKKKTVTVKVILWRKEIRRKLFTGTVPVNNSLFTGTVPLFKLDKGLSYFLIFVFVIL